MVPMLPVVTALTSLRLRDGGAECVRKQLIYRQFEASGCSRAGEWALLLKARQVVSAPLCAPVILKDKTKPSPPAEASLFHREGRRLDGVVLRPEDNEGEEHSVLLFMGLAAQCFLDVSTPGYFRGDKFCMDCDEPEI
ncbi:hypothetical protein H920_18919 [Fukomys damarensis]|uniref:Uncharacterized protein n=1 Tax=Fukomys damarensis TaxID=885580 RepID=A0A091CPQ4_FUKDA|nr:hypothetical protein H920_18919 [Fukomys damarensis]